MTGFGRCEIADQTRKITVEMKAVNHRYLDINIKMPKKLLSFESTIRTLLKEYIQRGKVDVFIIYENDTENTVSLKYNQTLAEEYVKYIRQMAEQFSLNDDLQASTLSRYPEVLTMEEQTLDEDTLGIILEKAVRGAAEQLIEVRVKEGTHLKDDLIQKLDEMHTYVTEIEKRSPQILTEYRQKLQDKVNELLADTNIEENRLAAEVTIYADKICTDEETVRLKSHLLATRDTLSLGGSVGRKLDFIAQEMNREANTILSKANDLIVSDIAINLKTNIEKVREQIQNIE